MEITLITECRTCHRQCRLDVAAAGPASEHVKVLSIVTNKIREWIDTHACLLIDTTDGTG